VQNFTLIQHCINHTVDHYPFHSFLFPWGIWIALHTPALRSAFRWPSG